MDEPIGDLAASAAVRLRGLAASVVHRRPVSAHNLWFELDWLSDPDAMAAIAAELKKTVTRDERVIYQFSVRDPAAYEELRLAFGFRPVAIAEDGKPLKYSRLMDQALPRALYVGSGKDFRTRAGQHIGRIGGAATYSMRLALWATTVTAVVDLHYWLYELDMDPIELEALEQELWDARQPLLGKRSGR